ncbi:MAG: Na(+)/H(+) antiporter subunit B [Clostridia bacterium]|nr:Na(+)/H(+) antiporter subunit B [Clostridia bacterium]
MAKRKMKENIIRKTAARLSIPFIQLYALYVIAHGELGPGGGFQGGVILGASVILFILAYGMEEGVNRVKQWKTDVLNSVGVLLYGGIGILCLFLGGKYLQYNVLPVSDPKLASQLGIIGIEIGVGITVAAIMITLFIETARRDEK